MRYVYNWGLDVKVKAYESEKKSVSYNELAKKLTSLKREEGKEWLSDVCIASSGLAGSSLQAEHALSAAGIMTALL